MSTAIVVDTDANYAFGGVDMLTQTRDGRLRVAVTDTGPVTITYFTLTAGTPTALLPQNSTRRALTIINSGANAVGIYFGANLQPVGIAAGATFSGFGGFVPTDALSGTSAAGTTLTIVEG